MDQKRFIDALKNAHVDFFTGVPDSYLNGFNNYLKYNIPSERNVITANEGNAIALAAGRYFATGRISLVYMQNSGLGNCVNPLLSLADKAVFSVPMILLIGWRGEPGTKDAAREQHTMQGKVTMPMLDTMEIPYRVLSEDTACTDAAWAAETARAIGGPVALIAPNGVMTEKKKNQPDDCYPLSREEAIAILLEEMPEDTLFAATTGRATRELYCQRELRGEGHEKDFLNIGSMGHASSVSMGLALAKPERKVVCLDGDSAAMMHMGAMTTVSKLPLNNFVHVVLNNGAHESVGGQPSAGHKISFATIARGCGYETSEGPITNETELRTAIRNLKYESAAFLDIRIHSGIRSDLGSIDLNSHEMINLLMEELKQCVWKQPENS